MYQPITDKFATGIQHSIRKYPKADPNATISWRCKKGDHKDCTKLNCSCKCGHGFTK